MQGPRNVPFQLAPPVDTQCTLPKLCPRIVMAGPPPTQSKEGKRGKPGCTHPDSSWIFAAHKPSQNPLQEPQQELVASIPVRTGTEPLPGKQGMFGWHGRGTVRSQGLLSSERILHLDQPPGFQPSEFRFLHSIALCIGSVIQNTDMVQENIRKTPADMDN